MTKRYGAPIAQMLIRLARLVCPVVCQHQRPEEPDHRHPRPLRLRWKRPRGCRAGEKRDELVSPHVAYPQVGAAHYHTVAHEGCCASQQNWSSDPELSSPGQSCLGYTIAMRGYDFREGHPNRTSIPKCGQMSDVRSRHCLRLTATYRVRWNSLTRPIARN
jgi:hypothetical protein